MLKLYILIIVIVLTIAAGLSTSWFGYLDKIEGSLSGMPVPSVISNVSHALPMPKP